MRSFRGRLVALGLAVFAVCAAAACTGDDGPASTPDDVPWTQGAPPPHQPFDVLLGDKLGIIDFAELTLRNRCLNDAGYPQNLNNMQDEAINPIAYLLVSAANFGPVTQDEARQNGFGQTAPPEPPAIVSFDPSYDKEMDRCSGVARDKLGFDASALMNSYLDLASQLAAFRGEVAGALPADLPEQLWQCMNSKGFKADHAEFMRTPNPTLFGVQFGQLDPSPVDNWRPQNVPGTVQVGPKVPARAYHPTSQESDLAVAWFQCSQQTRRVELELEAAFAAQQRYVDRFESTITELNSRVEDAARRAATAAGI